MFNCEITSLEHGVPGLGGEKRALIPDSLWLLGVTQAPALPEEQQGQHGESRAGFFLGMPLSAEKFPFGVYRVLLDGDLEEALHRRAPGKVGIAQIPHVEQGRLQWWLQQGFAQPQEGLVCSPGWGSHCATGPGGCRVSESFGSSCATPSPRVKAPGMVPALPCSTEGCREGPAQLSGHP